MIKSQPGVSDVHATTALGNGKKRKAKDFLSAIAETKGLTKGSDDQPRDEHGRWASGDGGSSSDKELEAMRQALREGRENRQRERAKPAPTQADEDAEHAAIETALQEMRDARAARKRQYVEWQADIKITKTDEDQQLVFGWASVTHIDGEIVIDKQGDIISSEELEKAAYDFVLYCREQGDMHERRGVGKLVESCVFTQEKMAKCGLYAFDPETNEQMFGWFCGFKTQDAGVWKRIKSGHLPEFSVGGRAIRVPIGEVA